MRSVRWRDSEAKVVRKGAKLGVGIGAKVVFSDLLKESGG
jgi:hypothetical protein